LAETLFRKFQTLQLNPGVDNGRSIGLLFTVSESEEPIGMTAPIEFLHEVYQRIPDLLTAAQQARAKAGVGTSAPLSTSTAGWCASECRVAMEAGEVRLEYRLGEDCRATLRMPRAMAERISGEITALLGAVKEAREPVAPAQPAARAASGSQEKSVAPRRNRSRSPVRKAAPPAKRALRAPVKREARKRGK